MNRYPEYSSVCTCESFVYLFPYHDVANLYKHRRFDRGAVPPLSATAATINWNLYQQQLVLSTLSTSNSWFYQPATAGSINPINQQQLVLSTSNSWFYQPYQPGIAGSINRQQPVLSTSNSWLYQPATDGYIKEHQLVLSTSNRWFY